MLFRCSSVCSELADRTVDNLVQNASCESLHRPLLDGIEPTEFPAPALQLRRSNLFQPSPDSDDGGQQFPQSDATRGELPILALDLLA